MRQPHPRRAIANPRLAAAALAAPVLLPLVGCEVDSFFDPSRTGYFEHTATTLPILERIDAVERGEEQFADAEPPTREDLIPSDLTYRIAAGDVVGIEIFDLYQQAIPVRRVSIVDQAGNVRVPQMGDLPAAGYTAQQLEDIIVDALQPVIRDPEVNVTIEEGRGFHYTLHGAVRGPGLYPLTRPDLRLSEALAIAGGVPDYVEDVYVIRRVPLSEEVQAFPREGSPAGPGVDAPEEPAPNIEDLIEQLPGGPEDGGNGAGEAGADMPAPGAPAGGPEPTGDEPQLGVMQDEPPIDVDDLLPEPEGEAETPAEQPQDAPQEPVRRLRETLDRQDTWIYLEEQGEWVRTERAEDVRGDQVEAEGPIDTLVIERVIWIPHDKLIGSSAYNVVIRPGDEVYVDPPTTGLVYFDGEIGRRGVYNMPIQGELTLSRAVAAAGGLGPLAWPSRVDLTRRLDDGRQATVRVNLRAIRNRTEPDILLKPDDEVIIGTSWIAAPLAVIRNGLRATYGFGFLLDRNFGNDVFGAPPSTRGF